MDVGRGVKARLMSCNSLALFWIFGDDAGAVPTAAIFLW